MNQPPPIANDKPHIADLVIDDIRTRKAMGLKKYGTPLQPFNGRNPLEDLYDELHDAVQYCKQKLIEECSGTEQGDRDEQDRDCMNCGMCSWCIQRTMEVAHESDLAALKQQNAALTAEVERLKRDLCMTEAERDAARALVAEARRVIRLARRAMQNQWHNKPEVGKEAACEELDTFLARSGGGE